MTQLDGLADSLAATFLGPSSINITSGKPVKASFASALRSAPQKDPVDVAPPATVSSAETSSGAQSPAEPPIAGSSSSELVPIDDTILQAIRKRDDRIFFSQYENQMAAFVQDPSRSSLELGAMNAYQRLLIHRCADQFHLDHQLDRATHCITLSKTPSTSHPSALLSIRAREHIVQTGGIDPVNTHPALAHLAGSSESSPSTSSPGSPAPTPATLLATPSSTPKSGFKIMRRDPSSSRQSPLRSVDNTDSDTDKAKTRKDMTLEEREASYKAARARIFGDVASSGASSRTSATPPPDVVRQTDTASDAALDSNMSPSNTAASSPVASSAGGRSAPRSKKGPSSTSSVTSQDGSSQRNRSNPRSKAAGLLNAQTGLNDGLEFSRVLPVSSGGLPQPSPLTLPGQMAHGYFPAHPAHSDPNMRSGAPAFHPSGALFQYAPSTQQAWAPTGDGVETEGFPALDRSIALNGATGQRRGGNGTAGGAWNRSQAGSSAARVSQEASINGVNTWAQQTNAAAYPYQQPGPTQFPQQQFYAGFGPSSGVPQYTHLGQQPYPPASMYGSRSATSSRASSQRGGGGVRGRDDAMSVSSISSTTSSRSASFSGVSGSGSASASQPDGGGSKKKKAPTHPSLPARPAWLSPSRGSESKGE